MTYCVDLIEIGNPVELVGASFLRDMIEHGGKHVDFLGICLGELT